MTGLAALASGVVDVAGITTFTVPVPATLSGATVSMHAVSFPGCGLSSQGAVVIP